MKRHDKAEDAFTLIELLVVILVIALLLSIVLPVINKSKEKARFVVCKSGLKQYGLAGAMYLQENDGCFPHPYKWLYDYTQLNFDGIVQHSCHWHDGRMDFEENPNHAGTLWPYLAIKDIHFCPTLRTLAEKYGPEHDGHFPNIPISPQYSYCMNGFLGDGPYSVTEKFARVKAPSDTFFFLKRIHGESLNGRLLP